jgi:hypothetical protein
MFTSWLGSSHGTHYISERRKQERGDEMSALEGLEGTDGKPREFKEFGQGVTHMMRLLSNEGLATAAKDNGSINVWKCDNGSYRAERHFYFSVRDSISTKHKNKIKEWLKVNFPKIQ